MSLRRREFLAGAGVFFPGLGVLQQLIGWERDAVAAPIPVTTSAEGALTALLDGNRRFVSQRKASPRRDQKRVLQVSAAQNPFALIVSCSDSRVVPEVLFDQGIGDLFVVRVAGNVVADAGSAIKGSIQYGVEHLNIPLVVVLGHEKCGAVDAAVKSIDKKDGDTHLETLVSFIKPIVPDAKNAGGDSLSTAVRLNVRRGVERIHHYDSYIEAQVKKGAVKIVGAVYDLESGEVKVL